MPKTTKPKPSELSFDERRQLLSRALPSPANGSCYIQDLYDDSLTYRCYDYSASSGSSDKKLYRCTYSIGEDFAVTLGEAEEVIARTVYEPVAMSACFSVDETAAGEEGDHILRTGKLFEAGSYDDKDFSMTEEELEGVVASYSAGSASMNIEHKKSVLDGQLGNIRRVWRQGKDLLAEFAVPRWLDTAAGAALKVSAEFDRATKNLTGAAWTINPRVTDAALMAAFSQAQENPAAPISAANGSRSLVTVKEGSPLDKLKEMFTDFAARFSKAAKDIEEAESGPAATVPAEFAASPEFTSMREQIARLTSDRIEAEAAAFAEGEVNANRATPAEKAGLVALFTNAANDDAKLGGSVNFAVGDEQKSGSRVDALRAAAAARPAHNLTEEALPSGSEVLHADTAEFSRKQQETKTADKLNSNKIYERRQAQTLGNKGE